MSDTYPQLNSAGHAHVPGSAIESRFDRRTALRLALGAGAVMASGGILAACGGSGTDSIATGTTGLTDTTGLSGGAPSFGALRVGYLPITDASPLLVAHGSGALARRGFDAPSPTLFRSWPNIVEAFQARQVDVVHLLMPLAVQLRFDKKQPVKVLTWNHTNGSALTVAQSINSVDDLAGTTVAIPFWFSIHNVVLQQVLRSRGLDAVIDTEPSVAQRTVRLVVMPPSDMPAALQSGSIAGFIVADPFNALAELAGAGKILRFTGDVWQEHACCVSVVHESFVDETPEAAQALVDAMAEAQLALRTDRIGSAQLLVDGGYLPQSIESVTRALTHYEVDEYGPTGAITHPEWGSERIGFQPYPFASYTERLITELRSTKVDGDASFLQAIDLASAHMDLVAVGLAEQAMETQGGIGAFGLDSLQRTEVISP
jgi:NitT/TauT family transport system substrate-binding protein